MLQLCSMLQLCNVLQLCNMLRMYVLKSPSEPSKLLVKRLLALPGATFRVHIPQVLLLPLPPPPSPPSLPLWL